MERGTRIFWAIVASLLAASIFFGMNAAARRRAVKTADVSLETGDLLRLTQVADGDTVVMTTAGGETVTVRVLGIKAFEHTGKDPASVWGQRAIDALQRALEDRGVTVAMNTPPKDDRGRFLAELYDGEKNVGLGIVKQGVALVYTPYPFPAMSTYLEGQESARAEGRGLWGDPQMVQRADALAREWRQRKP